MYCDKGVEIEIVNETKFIKCTECGNFLNDFNGLLLKKLNNISDALELIRGELQ